MNPHEKLAMEFFSPPGPSAREWRQECRTIDDPEAWSGWVDGATGSWPMWNKKSKYEIRLKPQTITLPERTIPKPLDVGELVDGETYYRISFGAKDFVEALLFWCDLSNCIRYAELGFYYPHTDQGKADAIAAAKGMCNWRDEG